MAPAQIIAFPTDRIGKATKTTAAKDASLEGSINRHPAKVAPKKPTNRFINLDDVLANGILDTNVEDISYRVDRLDVVLAHLTGSMNPAEMELLVRHIKDALNATSEVSYHEGLAEGYIASEADNDFRSGNNLGDPDF